MKKIFISLLFIFTLLILSNLLIAAPSAQAGTLWDSQVEVTDVGQAYGVSNPSSDDNSIQVVLAKLVRVFLGFLGIIFVILLVWAGYKYMTAAGNEDRVSEAIGQIRTAVIGLVIILISWSITAYITDCLLDITKGGMLWLCK